MRFVFTIENCIRFLNLNYVFKRKGRGGIIFFSEENDNSSDEFAD